MAVVAKPSKRTSKQMAPFLIVAILCIVGVVYASQGDQRIFADPASADQQQMLRRGKPSARNNTNRRISIDLAQLKNGGTGTLVFEIIEEWAPLGVQHLFELLDAGFYNDCRMFRVLPNFVAQFGMSGDPSVQKKWMSTIKDDPVLQSNQRGTLTYATSGKDSRTTQLFINFGNNKRLDSQGFAPIGRVVEGEEFLDQIQDMYREQPKQGQISHFGNKYLEKNFPELTYIQTVRVL